MAAVAGAVGVIVGFAVGLFLGRAERRTRLLSAQITADAYRELAAIVERESRRQQSEPK